MNSASPVSRISLGARIVLGMLLGGAITRLAYADDSIAFTDVTEQAGLNLSIPVTQSLAWGDYDQDGDDDLLLANGGPNTLYLNLGNGQFASANNAGLAGSNNSGHIGVAFGDLDNDGDLDVYLSHVSSGSDNIYRNDGADSGWTFTDMSADSGMNVIETARGASLTDYDRDGLLDVYACSSGDNVLYRNLGNFTFDNVADDLSVDPPWNCVGVVATDLNLDRWPDLFVANRDGQLNSLFINRGGTFTNENLSAGISVIGLGMGVVSLDYDNDLDFDLYYTTWPGGEPFTPNALYRNDGDLNFSIVGSEAGTDDLPGWGIDASTADIDNDGWEDIFITNGWDPTTSDSTLLRNNGDGTFSDLSALFQNLPVDARGAAFADYDGDGDQDLVVTGAGNEFTRLYRNDSVNDNHWIAFDLEGRLSNRSAIDTRVHVATGLRTTMKEVHGADGRGSMSSLTLEFGLGAAERVDMVEIYWPSGLIQRLSGLEVDTRHKIVEDMHWLTGSWYGGPADDGHGFILEALPDGRLLAYWFVFDDSGNRTWLVGSAPIAGPVIEMTLYTVDGGAFPPAHDPDLTSAVEFGTLRLRPTGCHGLRADWQPVISGFSEGGMDLQRLTTPLGSHCVAFEAPVAP